MIDDLDPEKVRKIQARHERFKAYHIAVRLDPSPENIFKEGTALYEFLEKETE